MLQNQLFRTLLVPLLVNQGIAHFCISSWASLMVANVQTSRRVKEEAKEMVRGYDLNEKSVSVILSKQCQLQAKSSKSRVKGQTKQLQSVRT